MRARNRFLAAFCATLSLLTAGVATPRDDAIALPPQRESFAAPDGAFELVITSVDGWKTPRSEAQLHRRVGDSRSVVWSRPLPHEYRPRYAVLGADGSVLLVDEWIHVASRYALLWIDPSGRKVVQHDFEGVRRALGLPAGQVAAAARLGAWVAVPPRLDATGLRVEIGAAGRTMRVDLRDGALSVLPPP